MEMKLIRCFFMYLLLYFMVIEFWVNNEFKAQFTTRCNLLEIFSPKSSKN